MAQFDVFTFPDGEWVVEVQADVIALAETAIVIPLVTPDQLPTAIGRLHPRLSVAGSDRILATHLITVVRRQFLAKARTSLTRHEHAIKGAIDFLIGGI